MVYYFQGEHDTIETEEIAPHQIRITRLKDGRQMDYYPVSSKGCWLGFDPLKYFHIRDIEAYLKEKFL